jgi:hypothetical protein
LEKNLSQHISKILKMTAFYINPKKKFGKYTTGYFLMFEIFSLSFSYEEGPASPPYWHL